MSRNIAIALIVTGICIVLFGLSLGDTIPAEVSQNDTPQHSPTRIWMFIGGVLIAFVGLIGVIAPAGRGRTSP
jgi:hypothetical protein